MSETSMAKKQPHTMYDPSFEKDACGMGFIANRHGESSHQLVDYALTMLERMNHRYQRKKSLKMNCNEH